LIVFIGLESNHSYTVHFVLIVCFLIFSWYYYYYYFTRWNPLARKSKKEHKLFGSATSGGHHHYYCYKWLLTVTLPQNAVWLFLHTTTLPLALFLFEREARICYYVL